MDSLGPINFQAHAGRVAQAYGVRKPAGAALAPTAREAGKATIGADGLVESGNARTIALKRIYQSMSSRFVMEKKELEVGALFAAGAAMLALLAAGLSVAWYGRVL